MKHPTDDVDPGFRGGLSLLLIIIAAWGAVDLVLDRPDSRLSAHVLVEAGFVALCIGAVVYLWRGWVVARTGLAETRERLQARERERDLWRDRANRLLRGLGEEIEAQFTRWSLTPTEKDVALLLLKGLGHREASVVMGRSERTVRQHAVSVYRKSGLGGRAELSAFFLEDLLLPQDQTSTQGRSSGS